MDPSLNYQTFQDLNWSILAIRDQIINSQILMLRETSSILEKVCPELIDLSTTLRAMQKYILTKDKDKIKSSYKIIKLY